ncbi:esterase-like activity of phytase family protein [Acinetobacter sp. ANC 3832]|uniref:esterase-like activity of phytase family protein n=1 Tax=Acinetobacter sp. ANC 3832 TaxID=1977874 RepID=UPI000A356429|nr:esterase-like activity of phytase family protein [Acinetobacter sp. ANC 3832]OTG91743.1 phytase esterase [Acinetobacter sp. ANC 3832]
MKKIYSSLLALSLTSLSACNDDNDVYQTEQNVTAPTLVSFAKLDVETYAAGPSSGAFVTGANGIFPPFKGQPVQGFSAALKNGDGTYMAMADNGFGTQDNSSDFLLRIYQIKPDFRSKTGGTAKVQVMSFIQLKDPNKLVPFTIINQNTSDRLLTGADFDPESMQRTADGTYWIGDEFGPYLLHFDKDGILLDAPIALPNPYSKGKELRSPQNQLNKANINYVEPLVQQSGGFEGMALSKDGQFLYPLLEKPLKGETTNQLLISQFDLKKKAYTGNYYLFSLNSKASNIGDFQMYDDKSGIIIERDASQNKLDAYKRLINVKLNDSGKTIDRTDLVDLMKIDNPNLLYGTARNGDIGTGSTFSFPFETIEDVIIENKNTLTVFNDNNFPGSSGRNAKLADDNEIIQIKLPKALY